MDLPLTSPAIPARSSTRGEPGSCTSCSFGFCSPFRSHTETRHSVSLPLSPLPLILPLGFPFSFCFFFLRRFFFPLPSSFLLRTSSLSLLGFPPPVLFRSPDHGCPPPPVRARVSGLRLFLVYRFPFFVKVSDTLIRCVVLFPFLHRDCCFARSRCNYLYLSSFDNVL